MRQRRRESRWRAVGSFSRKFDELVQVFAGVRKVFEKRMDNRDEEAGEALLWATAVRDNGAGRILLVGFVSLAERV